MTRGWALFWGLVIVTVGALALLFNLGLLQPEQLGRLAQLWPVLVILVGAQIVLARLLSRNIAAIVLALTAFLVLAGSVGYVLTAPPLHQAHRSFTAVDTGSGSAKLEVDLGAATIQVGASPMSGEAATASIDYTAGTGSDPMLTWDSASRTLEISHSNGNFIFGPNSPDHLTVSLNSSLSWVVELNTGASTDALDLGSAKLQRLSLDGGAATLNVTVGAPSGRVALEVNGGANRIQLTRPAGAATNVELNGGANSLQVDGHDEGSGIGSLSWSSPNYPAGDAIVLTVDGGSNHVTVLSSG